ncbi:MAG: hypothetical protein WD749_05350 [Phycisphaerales bacterium]
MKMAALAMLAAAGLAHGQINIGVEVPIPGAGQGTSERRNSETAIAVGGGVVAVAWNHVNIATPENRWVYYSASVDGGWTFSDGKLLPLPPANGQCDPAHSVDPVAASSFSGRVLLGGFTLEGERMFVSEVWNTGIAQPSVAATEACAFRDKPWMAIGTNPAGTQENVYLQWNLRTLQPPG